MSQNWTEFYLADEFPMQKSLPEEAGILGWASFKGKSA
jgi:hypothetical protein